MKSIRHRQKDETKTVIASTASPYKFTRSVMNDIDSKYDTMGILNWLMSCANYQVLKCHRQLRR